MAEEVKNMETIENASQPEADKQPQFEAITTQEALDAILKERLERAKSAVRKKYEGFEDYKKKAEEFDSKMSEYQTKIEGLEASNADLKNKLTKYESDSVKTRLVDEYSLPKGMEEFLTGENEKAWRKQAEKLAAVTKRSYPKKSHSDPEADGKNADLRRLFKEIRGD